MDSENKKEKKVNGLKEQMATKILVPLLFGVIFTAITPSFMMYIEGPRMINTIG